MHATGTWGAVTISLAARVLPEDADSARPDDGPGAAGYGHVLTRHSWLAASVLPDLLERHADVPPISWQVSPSGGLTGHIGAATAGGRDAFAAWNQALGLEPPVRTHTRLVASAEFAYQPVTIAASAPARPDPALTRPLTARRPAARQPIRQAPGCAQAPALPRPRPDSPRPGPSPRP